MSNSTRANPRGHHKEKGRSAWAALFVCPSPPDPFFGYETQIEAALKLVGDTRPAPVVVESSPNQGVPSFLMAVGHEAKAFAARYGLMAGSEDVTADPAVLSRVAAARLVTDGDRRVLLLEAGKIILLAR